ncbi:FAD dependent oxidoreductase [Aeromicrobium marinum DSM 15272]|uniref:FAD dependent oxidoreductase n=1 Tax=Aeromicrobium marinum DSM 15272 TaxID=585531 RepID=E2SD87_9ACTN|nr:NAD(P)/FAD-dependent oxidoreductase [Aeromicrobium marinum]EFQ82464.1 FAD dependent oxidoreductase [Aeromicrobium marinum DSM 15272]
MSERQRTPMAHTTVVIGAGFAGLGAAARLRAAGIEDVVVLERSDRVGGTWRDNTYPGAACDIPSLLYSYSFAQNPQWSRTYAGSDEILAYVESIADDFGVRDLIRFDTEVTSLTFDEPSGEWTVEVAKGKSLRARSVIVASGPLSNSSWPSIPGLDTYEGHKIHSARWDHDFDPRGKRIGVVGTGASAVQIIPELVKEAEFVKVFQRTPGWVMPRMDTRRPDWTKALFAKAPPVQTAARQAWFWGHEAMALGLVWNSPVTSLVQQVSRAHLRRQVKDPWMRRQLTPDFRAGCKRMLMSSDYYPALQADNCKLFTWPIATMSPAGIRTSDGVEHVLDAVVFATGYDISKQGSPIPVHGRDGRSLDDEWSGGVYAYKSASVSGYPNLFLTFGPNSGPGHNSALVYMEEQIEYAVHGVRAIVEDDLAVLDVRPEVQDAYNARMQERLSRTTWNSGCRSWYLTPDGFNGTMYPGFATQFARQMRSFRLTDYERRPITSPVNVT